jgi:hypothetical protein
MSDTCSGLKSPTGSYTVGADVFKLLVRRWGCVFRPRNVERCDNYVFDMVLFEREIREDKGDGEKYVGLAALQV